MFTGNADDLRGQEQQAREIAEQVAGLLTRLEQLGPVWAHNGVIGVFGCEIRGGGSGWSVR